MKKWAITQANVVPISSSTHRQRSQAACEPENWTKRSTAYAAQ